MKDENAGPAYQLGPAFFMDGMERIERTFGKELRFIVEKLTADYADYADFLKLARC